MTTSFGGRRATLTCFAGVACVCSGSMQSSENADGEVAIESTVGEWVRTLGEDTAALVNELSRSDLNREAKLQLAAVLLYIVRSARLVSDDIATLVYLDDAIILRVAAGQSCFGDRRAETFGALAEQTARVRELTQAMSKANYEQLETYVSQLVAQRFAGLTPEQTLDTEGAVERLAEQVQRFSKEYRVPMIAKGNRDWAQYQAFLSAKLSNH